MDWPRLAAGIGITLAVPFLFIVLPVILGTLVGRFTAQGSRSK